MLEITIQNGHASLYRDGHSVVETAASNLALRLTPHEIVVHTGINCFSAPWAAGVRINGQSVSAQTAGAAIGEAFGSPTPGAFSLKGEAPSLNFDNALASHRAGWTFLVTEAGTYAGHRCNAGDQIVCIRDGEEEREEDWTVLESNQPDMLLLTGGRLCHVGADLSDGEIDSLREQLRIKDVTWWTPE